MMEGTVVANDLRFAYLEARPDAEDAPLALFVHGFPDTAHTWDFVLPEVAKAGFRAVAPFQRGYHPTEVPKTEAYDADTLGQDVLSLIDALGHEKAVIVGHDWGASAVYSAAAMGPEKVSMMITLAIPHPAAVVPTPRLAWSVRHFFDLRRRGAAAKVRAHDFAHVDELVRRWSPAWDVPDGETDAVKAVFSKPECLDAALGYYRALRPTLPKAQRKKITVPSVSFAGKHDLISPPRSTVRNPGSRGPTASFACREGTSCTANTPKCSWRACSTP